MICDLSHSALLGVIVDLACNIGTLNEHLEAHKTTSRRARHFLENADEIKKKMDRLVEQFLLEKQ